jgi:hypothetical protein
VSLGQQPVPHMDTRNRRLERPRAEIERTDGTAPTGPVKPAASGDFESHLAHLISQSKFGAYQAGRISIIGLEGARERFGTAWERLASRADRIARNAIERYLLPGDIYTARRDNSYLIVFASLELDRARMKCLLIADEVMKALFGEEGSDVISVDSAVASLDRGAGEATLPLLDKLFKTTPAPDGDRHANAEANPAPTSPMPPRKTTSSEIQFAYRPMWDTALNVLSAYHCVPQLPRIDAGSAIAETGLALGNNAEALALADLAMQERVLGDLSLMYSERCRVLIVLCVHFETLAAAACRRRYVEALARSITTADAKLLVIEIVGVPDGVLPSRIFDFAAALRPYCRSVSACLRIECADVSSLKGPNIHAIGCDIGKSQMPELTVMQQLARFSRAAEKAGLASFVHGLRSVSLTGAAVGAGFRYIDGEGVSKLVDRPERVSSFSLSDIYRPILGVEAPPFAERGERPGK